MLALFGAITDQFPNLCHRGRPRALTARCVMTGPLRRVLIELVAAPAPEIVSHWSGAEEEPKYKLSWKEEGSERSYGASRLLTICGQDVESPRSFEN